MSDERKDLPASNSSAFLERAREVMSVYLGKRGDPLDRGVTLRDLTVAGVVTLKPGYLARPGSTTPISGPVNTGGSGSAPYTPDLTPPPTPSGLTVTATFSNIIIQHDAPFYTQGHGHARTRVYGAIYVSGALPTFSAAVLITEFVGTVFAHPTTLGTEWHIWIKWESVDGIPSTTPAGGTTGVMAKTGLVGTSDLGPLIIQAAHLADGSITASKVAAAAIDTTKFANGIEPITLVTGGPLPTVKSTSTVFWTDGKLYRWNGSAYISTLASTDLVGTLVDAQIASVAASKITGTLTDAQIAAVAAAKLTGQIVSTQITDGAISTPKLAAGSVTAANIAANTITAGQIAAGAITSTQLAAGAITAGKIAAGTIQAADIAAASISGDRLQANTITAGQIAANSITAGQIAAGAIGATQIAAGAITTGKLLVTGQGNAINADPNTQDDTNWVGGALATLVDSASPTGRALQITSTGGTTSETVHTPLDATKNYLLRINARQVSGTSMCYLGVEFTDAGGTILHAPSGWVSGSYDYFGLVNSQPPASYTQYQVAFGPGETAKIPAGAAYIRVIILGNYTGSGVQRFAGIRLMEKTDYDLIVDGAIIASKIAANAIAVGSAAIQDGAIRNALIANLAVDDAKIASLAVSKLIAGSLQVGSYIRSTSYVAGSSGWTINADGTAEFAAGVIRGQLAASQINTNGLSIRDTAGNIILAAGGSLAASTLNLPGSISGVPGGWLNSNVVSGSGNLYRNGDFTQVGGGTAGPPSFFAHYNNGGYATTHSVAAGGGIGTANYWRMTPAVNVASTWGFYITGGWEGWQPNTEYVWSFFARAPSGGNIIGANFYPAWNKSPASFVWLVNPGLTTDWQRYSAKVNFGGNVIDANGFISVGVGPNAGVPLDFSCIQIETGNTVSGWAVPSWAVISGNGRPADGATVGATWGANLFSTPTNLAQLSGSEGINNSLLSPAIASAAQTANWSQVADTGGRPANYATQNQSDTVTNNAIGVAGTTANWSGVANNDGNRPANGATQNQSDTTTNNAIGVAGTTANWTGVSNRPADDAIKNNLIDVGWWKNDAAFPWSQNGEYNRIAPTSQTGGTGPKGVEDSVWYCREVNNNGNDGGGWNGPGIALDPTKTYRFVVPIRRISGAGNTYWGTGNICNLNTANARDNPYFAVTNTLAIGAWHLFVGYVYPAGTTGYGHESAGVWNCTTGAKIGGGENYCFKAGDGNISHRAYQYYCSNGADQVFGRPMVNVVDGTEPSLREYFDASALLNSQQQWSDVGNAAGTRPANNATANQSDAKTNGDISAAGTTSYWSGVSNNDGNRPANGATVNQSDTVTNNLIGVAGTTANYGNLSGTPSSAIANTAITVGSNGALSGGGGGQVTIGGLGYSGAMNATYTTNTNQLTDGANLGGTANWSSVSSKPAFGTFSLLSALTQSNASTYVAAGAIGLAHIDTATITNLAALSAYTGTLTVDGAGWIRGGQTDWITGSGFFLGMSGGAYKFSVGDASSYMRWSPAGGLELGTFKLPSYAATVSNAINVETGNTSSNIGYGSVTAYPGGGYAPYSYAWTWMPEDYLGGLRVYISGSTTSANVSLAGNGTNSVYIGQLQCAITDTNGRVTNVYAYVQIQHGTAP